MTVIDSDFSALEGTNCYCSDESAAKIRQAISGLPVHAIHRIGTGDYHYVSLFWLERLRQPFTLVLFDNHPDDQPTAFCPDSLSCGSWVADVRRLPLCSDVIWVNSKSVVPYCPGKDVYLSVDLDVLGTDYARTNWDQGTMSLEQLCGMLESLRASCNILGIDICGGLTPQKGATAADLELNSRAENAIISLFQHQ